MVFLSGASSPIHCSLAWLRLTPRHFRSGPWLAEASGRVPCLWPQQLVLGWDTTQGPEEKKDVWWNYWEKASLFSWFWFSFYLSLWYSVHHGFLCYFFLHVAWKYYVPWLLSFFDAHLNFASEANASILSVLSCPWGDVGLTAATDISFFTWGETWEMRWGHHMELWEAAMGSTLDQEKPSPGYLSYWIKLCLKLSPAAWQFTRTVNSLSSDL